MEPTQSGTINPQDARQELITGLRNAHGLEQQAIEMLEGNVDRLENYPALKAKCTEHLEQSRQHQVLVAQCLEDLGESPSTIKDTTMGLVQNLQMMVHGATSDEVLKNSFAGYAFEHFEIAAYTALGVMARAAGEERIAQSADEILEQEQEMARWLEEHLPATVERYLMLVGSGEQKR
ncbi:ferritin-like domain-containing protein [Microvirga brassicacearum]|nr:ferritin-like domain-containing protein [Microvirga brassicacearum]